MGENTLLLYEERVQAILKEGIPRTFPKGTIISHQGKEMTTMYYIKKGIVRGYYINEEGKEVTKCFSSEGELFGVEGFLYERKATYFIEALEDLQCIALPYVVVKGWMNKDMDNIIIANKMIIEALEIMEDRAKALLLKDASERYQSFQKQYSNIATRLKQKNVASYLGIDEASLCRIKKKLT